MIHDIVFHEDGLVEVKIPKSTQAQKREEKRAQIAVDNMMEFPKFH